MYSAEHNMQNTTDYKMIPNSFSPTRHRKLELAGVMCCIVRKLAKGAAALFSRYICEFNSAEIVRSYFRAVLL